MYPQYLIDLTDGQNENLARAYKNESPINFKLKYSH